MESKQFNNAKEAARFVVEQFPNIFADYTESIADDDVAVEILSLAEDEGIVEPDGHNVEGSSVGMWTVRCGPSEVTKHYRN